MKQIFMKQQGCQGLDLHWDCFPTNNRLEMLTMVWSIWFAHWLDCNSSVINQLWLVLKWFHNWSILPNSRAEQWFNWAAAQHSNIFAGQKASCHLAFITFSPNHSLCKVFKMFVAILAWAPCCQHNWWRQAGKPATWQQPNEMHHETIRITAVEQIQKECAHTNHFTTQIFNVASQWQNQKKQEIEWKLKKWSEWCDLVMLEWMKCTDFCQRAINTVETHCSANQLENMQRFWWTSLTQSQKCGERVHTLMQFCANKGKEVTALGQHLLGLS